MSDIIHSRKVGAEIIRYNGCTYFVRWRKRHNDWKVTAGENRRTGATPSDHDMKFVIEVARLYYANGSYSDLTFKEFFKKMI